LLVEGVTAKDPAKPAKKDSQDSADQHSGDKSAKPIAKQNDNAAAAQTAPQPKLSAKAGKTDKNKDGDDAETDKSAADDKQVASVEQQMADQQALPPAPVVQAQIATIANTDTDTDTDSEGDIRIDAAQPAPQAPSPSTNMPQPDPMAASAVPDTDAAPQPPIPAQPDQADDDSETPQTVAAAAQAAPPDAKPAVTAQATDQNIVKDTAKPAAVKTSAKNEPAGTAKSPAAGMNRAKSDLTQADIAQSGDNSIDKDSDKGGDVSARGALQAKSAKADAAKDDNTNAVSLKGHAAHNSVASNNSAPADAGAPDVQKNAGPHADIRPADADNAAAPAAAKAVPQSVTASNAAFAINTIAAPQAAQNSQAPVATQHVQVTAQAAPNLPALAVEISAKSQSGAKQFDIRLDPPELGRVDVRLSIDATGKASAHLSADQPQTLTLLQKDAPILARALREAGLDVSQDGLNFSLRQQTSGQNGNDGGNGRFGGARSFPLAATISIDPTTASIAYRGLADGRVDIRV
jgi:chemotaxis protein MotD